MPKVPLPVLVQSFRDAMQQGDEVAALVPLKALSFRSDHSAAFLNACAPSIVCFSDASFSIVSKDLACRLDVNALV